MAVIDKAIEQGQKSQRDAESGQHGLFISFADTPEQPQEDKLPDVPDWDEHQRLAAEKEILGFFVSGHPLEKYRDKLADFRALSTDAICDMKQSTDKGVEITTGGIIQNARIAKSRKGDLYAQATLEDLVGSVDMVVFPEAYRRLGDQVKLDVPVLVRGGVRVEEGANPKLLVNDIVPLEQVQPKLPKSLRIKIPLDSASEGTLQELQQIMSDRKGQAKVLFDLERRGEFMVVMEPDGYNVHPDRAFIARVEELCGRGSVRIID
jgi:DNA polymerase-3 subunit alpha